MISDAPPKQPRIAVIGGGPGGLSIAWFLKQRGYTDVLVLEKLGRVGGLALTMNAGYAAFDLGANYTTLAYRETMKLARAVGAKSFPGRGYMQADVQRDGTIEYHALNDYTLRHSGSGSPTPLWRFVVALVRYSILRFGLRRILDGPTLVNVEDDDDLCVSLEQWLKKNDLELLTPMFEIPITLMGYGFLSEIPAPYGLKYMSLGNIATMVLRALPVIGSISPWPKRFRKGFQRLWEQVAWQLNVRMNVDITAVERTGNPKHPIKITLKHPDRIFHEQEMFEEILYFDELVIACPLTIRVLEKFLDLSEPERSLFSEVEMFSYCNTTIHCVKKGTQEPLELESGVLMLTPFTRATMGRPWGIIQLFPEKSNLLQFYSKVDSDSSEPAFRDMVLREIAEILDALGGEAAGASDYTQSRWRTYHRWPYFAHVSAESMKKGFFRQVEDQQGRDHTYYAGSATNFDLIETIVVYSKHLAKRIDEDVRRSAATV
jgi:hypothetical protein